MNEKSLTEKLQNLAKYVKVFVKKNKDGVEDIHKLRVKCRELFSLMGHDDSFYKRIKKVIKLSNKVRDLDVFYEVFIESLPKKYVDKLDIENIVGYTNKERKVYIENLHLYLKDLNIPSSVEFKYEEKAFEIPKIDELRLNPKALHKYRIYIKKSLYKEKNSYPLNEIKINILTAIKDLLGTINDNYNALKRLESYKIESKLFKKIEEFTKEQNDILFKEFKLINKSII